MGETGKQIWAILSVAIAGAFAVGISFGLYSEAFWLPPWLQGVFTYNWLLTGIIGIVIFVCVAIVLFRGIHPN